MVTCTWEDVQALLPKFDLTEGKPVTVEQVQNYIDTCSAEMELALKGSGYDTDPSDGASETLIKAWVAYGAAAMVLEANSPTSNIKESPNHWRIEFEAALKKVRARNAYGLEGDTSRGSLARPHSHYTDSPGSVSPRMFEIGKVQW
jgi:hypothetical protein